MTHIQFGRALVFVVLMFMMAVEGSEERVRAAIGYDRVAAWEWARSQILYPGCIPPEARPPIPPEIQCPPDRKPSNYMIGVLTAGGINFGNVNNPLSMNAIATWMIGSEGVGWDFVNDVSQVQNMDFVIFSDLSLENDNWKEPFQIAFGAMVIKDVTAPYNGNCTEGYASWNSERWCMSWATALSTFDETNPTWDYYRFVRIRSEAIGDRVWEERFLNGSVNGLQDGEELSLGQIPLTLRIDDQLQRELQTDAGGFYEFFAIPGQIYDIEVDRLELLDSGYVLTTKDKGSDDSDSDFSQLSGTTDDISLGMGTINNQIDLGLIRVPECPASYDIMIALDMSIIVAGSPNIITIGYSYLEYYTQAIVRGFTISATETNIGVVGMAAANNYAPPNTTINSAVEISLIEFTNRSDLIESIAELPRFQGNNRNYLGVSLWEGLRLSRNELKNNGRSDAQDVIIIVTDGQDREIYGNGNPITEANAIKAEGTRIYVVQLRNGNANDITRLQAIASQPLDLHLLEDVGLQTDLMSSIVELVWNLCISQVTRNYYTTSTPTVTWTRTSWATRYEIQWDDNPRFESPESASVPNTALEFTFPTQLDGIYYWRVRPFDANRNPGNWSNYDSFTIDAQ
jgi:hypothetical protein